MKQILSVLILCMGVSCDQIWVNQVPDYSSLNSCAEPPLSGIVRGQKSGCGALTSYSCFCTASSSHFEGLISTAVLNACPGSTEDADSATEVFSLYCQIGLTATTTSEPTSSETSTTPATSSASKTSAQSTTSGQPNIQTITVPSTLVILVTPPATTSTSTGSQSTAVSSESKTGTSLSGSVLNIVIVLVIAIVLLSIALAFFYWRFRKQRTAHSVQQPAENSHGASSSVSAISHKAPAPYYPEKGDEGSLIELDDRHPHDVYEIQSRKDTTELPVGPRHVAAMVKEPPVHKRVKSRTVRHSAQELL
ncbi:hypothetical protein LTR84_002468 [Exophiala bonariae]|uniref:CFEM domain-containing protein n=1 Tax=Exophiala bonariae TaxID=1690606 RepID=A0AAV9N9J9_9EURO|nr:hypothetical protein LTR84_002468 [Exophiala bonariae]